MKKIITLSVAILCVALVAVLFYGCGNDTEDMTTTTTTESTPADTTDIITLPDVSDGMVTDVSGENENGLFGDVVTDVSEGVSPSLATFSVTSTEKTSLGVLSESVTKKLLVAESVSENQAKVPIEMIATRQITRAVTNTFFFVNFI